MLRQRGCWYKLTVVFISLAFLVPILAACGGSSGNQQTAAPVPTATATLAPNATVAPTATPTATVAPTATATPSPTPNTQPVKIGELIAWSGPAAAAGFLGDQVIAVVQAEVKDMGGVLGGRPLQIVRYDSGSTTAGVVSGWAKLALQEKVAAVCQGGISVADLIASASQAQQYRTLFLNPGVDPVDLSNNPYVARSAPNQAAQTKNIADFIQNKLQPKTIAFIGPNDPGTVETEGIIEAQLKAGGAKTVYNEYPAFDVVDYSPYLTRIKFENPDVLIGFFGAPDPFLTVQKQISDLGGWGRTKFVAAYATASFAAQLPGAQGTYFWSLWVPGVYPASQKFEQNFTKINNSALTLLHMYYYAGLWTAINAIQLAGTDDPQAVAQASRSGKLQWDSPMGPMTIAANGENNLTGQIVQIGSGGQFTVVR